MAHTTRLGTLVLATALACLPMGTAHAMVSTDTAARLASFCQPHTLSELGAAQWNARIDHGYTATPGDSTRLQHPACYGGTWSV